MINLGHTEKDFKVSIKSFFYKSHENINVFVVSYCGIPEIESASYRTRLEFTEMIKRAHQEK